MSKASKRIERQAAKAAKAPTGSGKIENLASIHWSLPHLPLNVPTIINGATITRLGADEYLARRSNGKARRGDIWAARAAISGMIGWVRGEQVK